MPGRTETALYESGRATAPPGVRYNVPSGPSNEGYTHTVAATTSANLAEQIRATPIQSPHYTPSYSNFSQQRPQASPRYTSAYSPCPSPSPNYSANSKVNPSPQYTPNYSSSHVYSPSFGSSTFSYNNANANSNFDLPSTSSAATKPPTPYLTHENNVFPSTDISSLFNIPKSAKTNPNALPRYSSNYSTFSYFSNNQSRYNQSKSAVNQAKQCKDDGEFNCNIGDLQQFLSKHGSKIKADAAQDSVTDSLLNFLQRKTIHENFPYETSDINQILVSICSKNRSDDSVDLKRKEDETNFLGKTEEKRCRNAEEKKNRARKEILDEIGIDCDEKKIKRDAMSHYQEDKSHKRPTNYGDFNQWDYQDGGRRGMPFCGSSQSMAWNPMSMPHQTNPYYSNPHVIPAHAHTDYRYNQWNNPNHKNIQNAHSQNPQTKNSDLQMNSVRNTPQDMRAPTPDASYHPKTPTTNPLTDLQVLVTNQESDKQPENVQQESVDLSAHSDAKKEEVEEEAKKDESDKEKPVELTAKKLEEKEISSTDGVNTVSEEGKAEEPTKETDVTVKTEEQQKDLVVVLERLDVPEEKSEVAATSSDEPKPEDKPEEKKLLMEVESELQKMFEGVAEENPTVSSTSVDVKPSTSDPSKKTPKKRPSKANRFGSENSKKSKILKNKDEIRKKARKSLYELDKRGPILHLEGPRDSPSSVVVVNCPKGDDEDEKDRNLVKKQTTSTNRSKHLNELDYRGRPKNGLFSSTLSARYDAQSKDYTWICVFCKKGPHYNSLGDLFGPYIISKDENNTLCDFSGDEKDISDAQKRGGRNKKSIRANNMVDHFQKMSKKLRRCQSVESCLTGMSIVSDEQVDQLRYEVWVHEQCAVWSPNVCLIGSRIIGMQEAIWSSVKTMCSKCGAMGANIGCVHRNCPNRSHYDCARESGWSLQQETFISTCHIHKPRS